MLSDEQGYNSRVRIVDLLYLSTLLYAFSQFYEMEWWISYPIFFVISYSIALDWQSAVAMAKSGQFRYMVLDLFTVFNYFGLVNALKLMENSSSVYYTLFFLHYSIVFFIYVAWNIAILISNKSNINKRSKDFFAFFNIVGILAFLLCLTCVSQYFFAFISHQILLVIIILIITIHFFELLIWTYKTYFSNNTEQ